MSIYIDLPHVLAAFYGYLACHAYRSESHTWASDYIGNPRGQFFLRRATMATEFGASERSIDNYVTELIGRGYLQRVQRFRPDGTRRSSLYRLRLDVDQAFPDDDFTAATRKNLRPSTRKDLRSSNRVLQEEQSSFSTRSPDRAGIASEMRTALGTVSEQFGRGWSLERSENAGPLPDRWSPNAAHWKALHDAWDRGVPVRAEAAFRAFDDFARDRTEAGAERCSQNWGAYLLAAIRALVAHINGDASPGAIHGHDWVFTDESPDWELLVDAYGAYAGVAA